MMRYNKGNNKNLMMLLLLFIGIGYAALSATLNIVGNTSIKSNTWDVHFDNIDVKDGSVDADEPKLSDQDTKVSFEVTLAEPGDKYEFTVDAVNAGTIDAVVNTVTKTELTDEQAKYLNLKIEYEDGTQIKKDDLLKASNSKTMLIYVEYRKDLKEEDLPDDDIPINISLSVDYVQAKVGDDNKDTSKEIELTKDEKDEIDKQISADYSSIDSKYVAKIGNSYYETLTAAIDSVTTSDRTIIEFLDDITENVTIKNRQNIIFNARGYELIVKGVTNVNGNLILAGEGNYSTTFIMFVVGDDGNLIVQDGNFDSKGGYIVQLSGLNSKAVINGGVFTGTACPIFDGTTNVNNSTLLVNANLDIQLSTPVFTNIENLTINGGSYASTNNYAILNNKVNGSTVINGGIFHSLVGLPNIVTNADVVINDGQFDSFIGANVSDYNNKVVFNGGVLINNSKTTAIYAGVAEINGGTIISNVYMGDDKPMFDVQYLKISNGDIRGKDIVFSGNHFEMTGGTIESTISNAPIIAMKGGTLLLKNASIKNTSQNPIIADYGVVYFFDDINFTIENSIIDVGSIKYAIYSRNNKKYFYDSKSTINGEFFGDFELKE